MTFGFGGGGFRGLQVQGDLRMRPWRSVLCLGLRVWGRNCMGGS